MNILTVGNLVQLNDLSAILDLGTFFCFGGTGAPIPGGGGGAPGRPGGGGGGGPPGPGGGGGGGAEIQIKNLATELYKLW